MHTTHENLAELARACLVQEFTVNSRVKDSNIEQSLAASYKTDKYSVQASINPAGKVCCSANLYGLSPVSREQSPSRASNWLSLST